MFSRSAQKKKNSLARRRWKKFKSIKRGYYSLVIFGIAFILSLFAEFICNDKPFVVYYNHSLYFPIFKSYPETTFGGDFETEADYLDPYILDKLEKGDNWVIFPPIRHSYYSIDFDLGRPVPSAPDGTNYLGTDDRGRQLSLRVGRCQEPPKPVMRCWT